MAKQPQRTGHQRRLGIRDRLGQLTYQAACRLFGDDGHSRLRQASQYKIQFPEAVYFGGDTLRVTVDDPTLASQRAIVTIVEMVSRPKGLQFNCDQCQGMCEHVAAAVSMVLEDKFALGLSAAPDPNEPIELLTEDELIRRAIADRQERADEEKMTLRSTDAESPWTDYVLTSEESGKTYRVSLRGHESGQSYCTCPDFRTNHLGTCKHILHTLAKVQKRFAKAKLEEPYQRKNFSVRLDYRATLGLQFNVPNELDDAARQIIGKFGDQTTENVEEMLKRIRALEREGHEVHVYPDAEEFIQQRLQQNRLKNAAAEIRKDPTANPLRTNLLKVPLLPYQMDGIAFSVGAGRAVLADDMGLGKTIQGIGVAELFAQLADIKRVLVVCPATLKSQWRSEIAKFCDRDCQIVLGSAEERVDQYNSHAFFTICNYEQVLRDETIIASQPWDLIILDEGQRIKNWESRTSQVIKSLRSTFALVLSGTPLENRLEELYTVVGFIDDRRLGPAYRFFHRHRLVDEKGKVQGYHQLDVLRDTLKPILLRRTRASVMQQLPERTTEIVRIRPTDEQWNLSNEHSAKAAMIASKKFLTEMDLLRLQKHLLAARMACDSTFLVDKEPPGFSSKLERLDELLTQLIEEPDRKIVLFSEWTTMLNLIEPIFTKLNANFVRLDGKVPQKKREDLVHQFQTDPTCRAIIMSNAGTTGLNLQSANTVINVDLPWNPAVLEQRVARAHRMGQKQPVHVYLLVTEDCFEERMLSTLSAKHDLALAALDVDSEVSSVELQSGMEELKRRLERLLGEKPTAPVDESLLREVEAETTALAERKAVERREKVAAAGGELLGAALNLVGQLLDTGSQPNNEAVSIIHQRLTDCVEKDETGRPQLRFTLPNDEAVKGLAETLAKLLAVSSP